MHRLFRVVSILMLALVCFHVVESDGPCDYEEYFTALKSTVSYDADFLLPEHSDIHHIHDVFVPDHLGHTSVVLMNDLQIVASMISFTVTFPDLHSGDIQKFVFENYRPPRLS